MPIPNITTTRSGASSEPTWKLKALARSAVRAWAIWCTTAMMKMGRMAMIGLRNTKPRRARISTSVAMLMICSAEL